MNNNLKSVVIPFEGFYQSVCDLYLDDEIEQIIEDIGAYPNFSIDFVGLAKEYIKAYMAYCENEYAISLNLVFEELIQPREYNFITDKIVCTIAYSELEKLHTSFMLSEEAQGKVVAMFASRDGFSSFYDDFVDEWQTKPLSDWDDNELSVLLPIVVDYCDLWDSARCNGVFSNAINYEERLLSCLLV